MRLVCTEFGYNFWIGINSKGEPYYNITPIGQPKPQGGYMSSEYISRIKGVTNFFEQY